MKNEYREYPYIASKTILSAYKKDLFVAETQNLERKIKELKNDYNFQRSVCEHVSQKEIVKFIEYFEKQDTT